MEIEYICIHLAITLLYFLVMRRKAGWKQAGAETLLVFCLPVIGFLSFLIWHVLSFRHHKRIVGADDRPDQDESSAISGMIYQSDIVPFRDMDLIGNERLKRRLFMTAITQEVVDNPEILREAVHDGDREISYYAVSLITARTEKITSAIFGLEKQLKNVIGSGEEIPFLKEYAHKLMEFLDGRYGDENQRKEREKALLKVLEKLADRLPDEPEWRGHFLRLAIKLHEYSHAEALITLARKNLQDSEEFIRLALELAVARRDRKAALSALEELKAFPGRLSYESLKAIRYWGGAA